MSAPLGQFFAVGVNHRTADLALRERLAALQKDRVAAIHRRLQEIPGLRERVILSTCNRMEFYLVTESDSALAAAERVLADLAGVAPAALPSLAFRKHGLDAAVHLFTVASSLDSQIVGETEILGQFKAAYALAQEHGATGPALHRLLQKAIQAAKWIRSNTLIGEGQVSIATVAANLAGKIFGRLSEARTLVVGAGDIAEKTAVALRSQGVRSLFVTSRRAESAAPLAAALGGGSFPFAELPARLSGFDIVISSTAAPHPILTLPVIAAAARERAGRPLFLIDLALPRDIDPAATTLADVFVYNLDDLAEIAAAGLAARLAEVDRARAAAHERAAAQWGHLAGQTLTVSPATEGAGNSAHVPG